MKLGAWLVLLFLITPLLTFAVPQPQVFHITTCPLDLKLVIEILADYDVEHQSVIDGGAKWGLTDPQRRKIFISQEPDFGIRKQVVIHEMIHVCYRMRGGAGVPPEVEEIAVQAQVADEYKKLFTN